jgi:hypothetical protein
MQIHFEDVADDVGLAAVNDELQALAHECIGLAFNQRLESEESLLAGDVAPLDHSLDQLGASIRRRAEQPRENAPRVLHYGQWRLNADGRNRAHDDDHEGRCGHERRKASTLQHRANHDGADCEHETYDAENIHGSLSQSCVVLMASND